MRFSVITISYNASQGIGRTVESVLSQTFTGFEYILIDGASGDDTNAIIETYIPGFQRQNIPVFHKSEPDEGISDAFNKGIRLASGEIIAIINAGDTLLPDALETVDRLMEKDTDVVYGNVIWNRQADGVRYIRRAKADLSGLMYNMDVMHPAAFVRRSMYDRAGLFDVRYRYCMDQEFLVRVQREGGRFRYADQVFAVMEAGGVSDRNVRKVLEEAALIPQKYGEPGWKVFASKWYKYLRNKAAHVYRRFVKN